MSYELDFLGESIMNIECLPTELKLKILSFLDTSFVQLVATRVNREFYNLSKDPTLYRTYIQKDYDYTGRVAKKDLSCTLYKKNLRQLTIKSNNVWKHLSSFCFPRLTEVCVAEVSYTGNLATLPQIAPNLRVVRLMESVEAAELMRIKAVIPFLDSNTEVEMMSTEDLVHLERFLHLICLFSPGAIFNFDHLCSFIDINGLSKQGKYKLADSRWKLKLFPWDQSEVQQLLKPGLRSILVNHLTVLRMWDFGHDLSMESCCCLLVLSVYN